MVLEPLSLENLIRLLQKCRQQKSIEQAWCLHALLCEQDLDIHPLVGNHLVPTLVDCGCLPEAQYTFDRLPDRREQSWSSLICGYVNVGDALSAFHIYHTMQDESHVLPSRYTYLSILRACSMHEDSEQCHVIHASAVIMAWDRELLVGNCLIDVYARCNLLTEAHHVFNMLPMRDIVSCNSLIAGYTNHEQCDDAITLFDQIEREGLSPDHITFPCILKACGNIGDVNRIWHFNVEVLKRGLDSDLFVGNALIYGYSKCGCLAEAHQLLSKFSCRDVVSWNSLIGGYAEEGDGERVLHCLESMQRDGLAPDDATFVSTLKACGISGARKRGARIHAEVVIRGLEQEARVANILVDMYVKCGSYFEASKVVDQSSAPDVVMYNVLITSYLEMGINDKALKCFEEMEDKGISPDAHTLVACLQACCDSNFMKEGQLLCIHIAKKGLETNIFVGSAIVDLCAKLGLLADAHETLKRLPKRNVVSWTALIGGYAEYGYGVEVLSCYKQMQLEGISPVAITYTCSLKACGSVGDLEEGLQMHIEATKRGLDGEIFVGNTLVDMYAKNKALDEAQAIFDKLIVRNVVAWTSLIAGFAEGGYSEQVLSYYTRMQEENVTADAVTFIHGLKACGTRGALEKGQEIHAKVKESGLENDLVMWNALLDMYGKCGSTAEAQELFDRMPVHDIVSWNTLIQAYGENQKSLMAMQCFKDMQEHGVKPDAATFVCLLIACSHGSLVDKGQELFRMMTEKYGIKPIAHHYSCMADLLARSGHVFEALRYAEALLPDIPKEILMVLLTGCKVYGEVELAERCFEEFIQKNPEVAAAYRLMADIYAMCCRWDDMQRVEEMREQAKAEKKLAIASVEVNKTLHQFIVGDTGSTEMSMQMDMLSMCMRDEGYVPNVDSIFKY